MPMMLSADSAYLPFKPGESRDIRPLNVQRDEAEFIALVLHLNQTGQEELTIRDWLLNPKAVKAALAAARHGGQRQLRRAGVL